MCLAFKVFYYHLSCITVVSWFLGLYKKTIHDIWPTCLLFLSEIVEAPSVLLWQASINSYSLTSGEIILSFNLQVKTIFILLSVRVLHTWLHSGNFICTLRWQRILHLLNIAFEIHFSSRWDGPKSISAHDVVRYCYSELFSPFFIQFGFLNTLGTPMNVPLHRTTMVSVWLSWIWVPWCFFRVEHHIKK